MAKVNTHNPSILQVHHKVREVTVTYAQHILAHADRGHCLNEVGAKSQEGFWGCCQLHICTPVEGIDSLNNFMMPCDP